MRVIRILSISHGCLPRASGLLQQATLPVVTRHPGGPPGRPKITLSSRFAFHYFTALYQYVSIHPQIWLIIDIYLILIFESNLKYTINYTIIYVLKYNYRDILLKNKELWRRDLIVIFAEIHKKTTMLLFVVLGTA